VSIWFYFATFDNILIIPIMQHYFKRHSVVVLLRSVEKVTVYTLLVF